MDRSDSAKKILALFEAFLEQDRDAAEKLLADDFTFTSPYDDRIDKTTYFERCWPNRGHIVSQTLDQVCVEDYGAFVLYECTTGGGKRFRNVEFFTFAGDRIASVSVYFGATYKNGSLLAG